MTKEEKELLLKDLCARLPYKVKVQVNKVSEWDGETKRFAVSKELTFYDVKSFAENGAVLSIKPYLRPMSSMTDKEINEFHKLRFTHVNYGSEPLQCVLSIDETDWLNTYHFDYRGLIDKGLALPAPADMYNL